MAGIVMPVDKGDPFGTGVSGASTRPIDPQIGAGQRQIDHSYRHPLLLGAFKAADVSALAAALMIGIWSGTHGLAEAQVRAVKAASLACTLVFLLFPKRDRLLDVPSIFFLKNQLRYLVYPLMACGIVAIAVLLSLGWKILPIVRIWPLLWIASITAVGVERWIGTRLLARARSSGRLARKIAIIGDGSDAFQLAAIFGSSGNPTFEVVGVFADGSRRPDEAPVQSSIADLIAGSRERQLDGIIIAIPRVEGHESQVARLVWRLRSVLADVYIMPHLVHGADATMPVEAMGPVSLMVLKRRPLNEWQMVSKSAFDLAAGLVLFVALLPVLLLVAVLIRIESPGPVLFRQPRLGFNNRHFTVLKFRSMYTNMTDTMAERQTGRDDPRVTKVGKWIRKLSVDELPQLLNVIRGDMSLVGPRPHAPHTRAAGELLDDALAEYAIRHQVKPGITGWAQVNGSRGELVTHEDLRRRVELDLDYIQRWSLWFDIKIMFLTVCREIVSRHAF